MAEKKYPLQIVIEGVDRITAPMRRINDRVQRGLAPLRRFNNGLRGLGRAAGVGRLAEGFRGVGRATGQLTRQVGALGAKMGGVAAIAGGLGFVLVDRFARSGDEVAKLAKATGWGVEALQEWQYAADRSGVSQQVFNSSMTAFGKRLGELKAGTGGLFTMLKRVNPELAEQLATTDDTGAAFQALMGYMSDLEDPAKRAAVASAAFSRQGLRMANVAAEGREGMASLRKEAQHYGQVMGDDAAANSEAYVDAMTNAQAAMVGVRNIIGTALLPVVIKLTKRFTEFVVGNRAAIKQWAQDFAARLPGALASVREGFRHLLDVGRGVASFLQTLTDHSGLVKAALAAVAVVIMGPSLLAIAALTKAMIGLGVAMMTTPIGWVIGGIALLAAGAALIITNWGAITEWWAGVWDAIGGTVHGMVGSITGWWDGMVDSIKSRFTAVVDWIKQKVAAVSGLVPDWMKEGASNVQQAAGSVADGARGLWDRATGWLGDDEAEQSPGAGRAARVAQGATGAGQGGESRVRVSFDNMPKGARVREERNSGVPLDMDLGYSMAGL